MSARKAKTLHELIDMLDELVSLTMDVRYTSVNALSKNLQVIEKSSVAAMNYALALSDAQTKVKK